MGTGYFNIRSLGFRLILGKETILFWFSVAVKLTIIEVQVAVLNVCKL
jgi:hypothetical protein